LADAEARVAERGSALGRPLHLLALFKSNPAETPPPRADRREQ
jgi:hypothetical protein